MFVLTKLEQLFQIILLGGPRVEWTTLSMTAFRTTTFRIAIETQRSA